MNGIVSVPPPSAPCTGQDDCALLVHADGFFPEIDMHALRDTMRIGTAVTDARLLEATQAAMTTALRDLALWRTDRILEGFDRADQVVMADPVLTAGEINGEHFVNQRWRRAVYNYACGELMETHRDATATGDGADRAEERASSADEYRRDGLHAVRDILGVPRIVAELI